MMDPMSALIGVGVSWLVSGLKRIPVVSKYPKVTSAILSTAIPGVIATVSAIKGNSNPQLSDTLISIASQAATAFTSSVATHEVVTHTINNIVDTK